MEQPLFMRRIPVLAVLLLASCVAGPAPGTSSGYYLGMPGTYATQPQPVLSSTPSSGRTTQYAGHGDGSLLAVQMTSLPGGRTRVELGTQGDGTACAGSFEGVGASRGSRVVVRDTKNPACQITFTRTGRRLTVDDGQNHACFQLHGAQCGFAGQLAQR